jgi:addiction module RelB/DinJ family antitoxin
VNSTIVAARVPGEIREQGNTVLAELGFTPTQLINSAYRYVLEYGRLPFEASAPKPGKRVLPTERMEQIADELTALRVCGHDYSRDGTRSLKDVLEKERRAEYEALA